MALQLRNDRVKKDMTQPAQLQLSTIIEECHCFIRQLMQLISNFPHQLETLAQENQALKQYLNLNSNHLSVPASKNNRKEKEKNKSAFDYLSKAIQNHFYQLPAPPLIQG